MKISDFWYKFFKYTPGVLALLITFVETVFPVWGCPDSVIKVITVTLAGLAALITGLTKLSSNKFWQDKTIVETSRDSEEE